MRCYKWSPPLAHDSGSYLGSNPHGGTIPTQFGLLAVAEELCVAVDDGRNSLSTFCHRTLFNSSLSGTLPSQLAQISSLRLLCVAVDNGAHADS